jgi:predicted transglutaminase-like cysteine proteinase
MVAGGGADALNGLLGRVAKGSCRRRSALLLGRGGARRRMASGQTDRRSAAFARRLRFQIALEQIRQRDAQPLLYGVAGAVTAFLLFAATPSRASLPPDGGVRETIVTPALFGTREIRYDNIDEFPQWTAMLRRADAEIKSARTICRAGETQDCMPEEWAHLVGALKPLSLLEKIERANAAINRHPYVPTERNWHRVMYWEAPFEFLRRGGQCQDYAIAKYELLRQANVPADLMRMVVLHAANVGQDHAVLAVDVDDEWEVLDILDQAIRPSDEVRFYHPYYSINENNWWLHIAGPAISNRHAVAER